MRIQRRYAALLLFGLAVIAMSVSACTPSVPNVVGQPFDQAVKTLQDAGYKLGTTQYGYTSAVAPATVARQNPSAGTSARRGTTVTLMVTLPLGSVLTPDIVGLTQEAAESALSTQSLVASATQDYSDTVAKGLVISQAPQAAVPINPGDTVAFVVSKGPVPPKVSVPNINGKTEADAKKALEAVGLVAAPSQAYSGTVVKGSVFGQNPSSGVKVDPGAKVTFVVSLGKGTQAVTVPNVVGKSQADAETALRNAGLVPSVVQQKSATVAKGVVAAQSPAAGATTAKGAVIGIVVSLGPDSSVSVPNVVGMTAADAEAAITAAGLVPSAVEQPDGEIPKGTVITQAPAAGTKAALGTTVLFTVSSGPPPPPQ